MITIYSPLRISFAGGGTDISPFLENYGGAVLNTTIDRGILLRYINDGCSLEISSRDFLKTSLISSNNTSMENAIIKLFTQNNINTGRVILNGDVPPGSGLGSSSAFLNGILKLIHTIKNENINSFELAEESYSIERNQFDIILGRQDSYAISLGGFKYTEFQRDSQIVTRFSEDTEFFNKLQRSLLLVYTGHTRESSTALKEQVLKSTEGDKEITNSLMAIKNLALRARDAVRMQNITEFYNVINEGWYLKKKLGNNITNDRIDNIIEKAKEDGARAARLLGGGSEGFILLVTVPEDMDKLEHSMMAYSDFVIRIKFDKNGTRIVNNFISSDKN